VRHIGSDLGLDEIAATDRLDSLAQKSMIVTDTTPGAVRYRMLETMRAYAAERLDESGERHEAHAAHARWVASIVGLPPDDPCTADVERASIRLDRESDDWREAMAFALRARSSELAAQLCGPPAAFFLLGRHDLAGLVRPLVEICSDDPRRLRSVLTALVAASAGDAPTDRLWEMAETVQRLDDDSPTGVGSLMRWLAKAWQGEIAASIAICTAAIRDERLPRSSRDMLTGIATLDCFSLTETIGDPHGLVDRALEVAERTDVVLHRVTCLLGAAWGLTDRDPNRALQLVGRALEDIESVPALMRITIPGSASRLLTRIDPGTAARSVMAQLEQCSVRRSFIDFIPVFYAAALLHRVGHPSADAALATLAVSPLAPYLSMMDFGDLARQATASSGLLTLNELEANVRAALREIADGQQAAEELPSGSMR